MVLSGEIPLGRYTRISTLAAVLSSMRLIFIFPLSLAFKIESIKEIEQSEHTVHKIEFASLEHIVRKELDGLRYYFY